MFFNSVEFGTFFAAVCAGYFLLPFRFRWLLLLAGSYFFYMSWRWQYGFVIAVLTFVNFFCGRKIERTEAPGVRRFWLVLAVCLSLGILFFFKYYGLANRTIQSVGQWLHLSAGLPSLHLVLPIGISFYTLAALGYTLDVYYRRVSSEMHPGRFALFVAFFPVLLAGPIERAGHLLVQFRRENHFDFDRLTSGLTLFLWGLFKKVVIADRLAIYVSEVYTDPHGFSGSTLLLAAYFFTFQIYCDFSGYSDMAVGVAQVLGYDLLQNFNLPYFATSIADFWRRWHISLSTWFRDYVYFPLGGSHAGHLRWAMNILMVFVISGLWHGASWTFGVWGALHGFYYLFGRLLAAPWRWLQRLLHLQGWFAKAIQILLTFHLVVFAWIFFRVPSIHDAWFVVTQIFTDFSGSLYEGSSQLTTVLSILLIMFLLSVQVLQSRGHIPIRLSLAGWPVIVRWPAYAFLLFGISLLGIGSHEFIYFQF